MKWFGPYTVEKLLRNCLEEAQEWPESKWGVYVVSKHAWEIEPTEKSDVLYVGSNTGKSARFVTRIGDLVADIFGFFTDETGHHSGGIRLYEEFCMKNKFHPFKLQLGWAYTHCPRCLENKLYDQFKPQFNKKRPPRCKEHML